MDSKPCKYCGCMVYYNPSDKKFYETPQQIHDYETRCKVFQKSGQYKANKPVKEQPLPSSTTTEQTYTLHVEQLINIAKSPYTEAEIKAAQEQIDKRIHSVIFTIDYVTKKLADYGVTNPNPQLVGMIVKIIREEARD